MIIIRPIHVMESRSHWLRATSSYLRFAARNRRRRPAHDQGARRMEEPRNGATVCAPVSLTPSQRDWGAG